MNRITLPKRSIPGLKIYCNKCKKYNPICKNHNDKLVYRAIVHLPGTKNNTKNKTLNSTNYEDAVNECLKYQNAIKQNNYYDIPNSDKENINDCLMTEAVIKFFQYLNGDYELKHLKKNISDGHIKELIRHLKFFCKSLCASHNFKLMKVIEVTQSDVSKFYGEMEIKYAPRTFNKIMMSLKQFFNFLIEIEGVKMINPFKNYNTKTVAKSINITVNKDEFEKILKSVDDNDSIQQLGGKGEKKNMYRPYLKDGYKLCLLTGLRREEVVDLKWNDIYIINDIYFFMIQNKKVTRNNNIRGEFVKYIPINLDLLDLLQELGYDNKKFTDEYILCPNRRVENVKTIMDILSKSFTFYKNKAGIQKNISLKNLRKTYISWVYQSMEQETGKLTSHSTNDVLKNHYIDQTMLNRIQRGMLEIRIFG